MRTLFTTSWCSLTGDELRLSYLSEHLPGVGKG